MSPLTANLIKGAISQSGPAMFDQSNQQSEKANQSIMRLCEKFPTSGCNSTDDPDEMIESLRNVHPKDLTIQGRNTYTILQFHIYSLYYT